MPIFITHDGTFHADDVLAYVVLSHAYANGPNGDGLVRTRQEGWFRSSGDLFVFDVGGVYDPGARRYDHHMNDRPRREDGSYFSSVGLVWRHHGMDFLRRLHPGVDDGVLSRVWARLDMGLIRAVDDLDNGIGEVRPDLFARIIAAFNPQWDSEATFDSCFLEAAAVASKTLLAIVKGELASERATEIVRRAIEESLAPSVVVLPAWTPSEHVVVREAPTALYVVFPKDGLWYCRAVPDESGSFRNRMPFPRQWAGLRGEVSANVSGISDAEFCHPSLFICGARSREGALGLAMESKRIAVESTKDP